MTASATQTGQLLAKRLTSSDADHQQPRIRIVNFRHTNDAWPLNLSVVIEIDGIDKPLVWNTEFGCEGLEHATEPEVAQSIELNIRVLLREMVATGNLGELTED
jgi:hypothetical protein